MAPNSSKRSPTVAVSGPGQSIDGANGRIPSRGRDPKVGLRPKVPHMAAGIRTEPPVSEPRASGAMPVDTVTAAPPLDPPVILAGSHGFAVRPHADTRLVPPAASSCWFVLPTGTAPA